jgi:hypothetical protein
VRREKLIVALEARYDTALQPVKVTNVNTETHKTTYRPLIDT